MGELTTVREAVAGLVEDGDSVALEGFTHLIPHAAAHEIIRQERRRLTLIRMTPDLIYDQMIGMGCAQKLIFSYVGNPGVGSLRRFRDAVENGWPRELEIEEHSHAGMASRYVAGASNLPFAVLRGCVGTDLPEVTGRIAPIIARPFTGEELMAVPALKPDVAIIHAQQAERRGNVAIWGITGIQKEAVLCARRSIVTVEIVEGGDGYHASHSAVVRRGARLRDVGRVPRRRRFTRAARLPGLGPCGGHHRPRGLEAGPRDERARLDRAAPRCDGRASTQCDGLGPLRVADDPGMTDPPTEEELRSLRYPRERTEAANEELRVLRYLRARTGARREATG